MHGHAWLRPWEVEARQAGRLVLRQAAAPAWPWPYELRQEIALQDAGVTLSLALTNRSPRVAPVGLGFHPYFRAGPDTVIETAARTTAPRSAAWARLLADGGVVRSRVAELPDADVCLEGWGGAAVLAEPDRRLRLEAHGCARLHLYRPPDGASLCLEPVMNRPSLEGRGAEGLVRLQPGETRRIKMTIRLDEHPG